MSNSTRELPPTPLFSDYVEMSYLSFVVLLGIPSNLFILRRLLLEMKRTPPGSVRSGFLLLKINLNISDLFLLLMAIGKVSWLYTYEWVYGDVMCRLYQFLSMSALYVSSNIVVCISIDRLRNVLGANKIHSGKKHLAPVKLMILLSWLFAISLSLPQLFVFETVDLAPHLKGGWHQCSDVWQIYGTDAQGPLVDELMSMQAQDIYNISHLVIVFWGPLSILVISYVLIATRLMHYALQGVQAQQVRAPLVIPSDIEQTEDPETFTTTDTSFDECTKKIKSWIGVKRVELPRLIEKRKNDLNGQAISKKPSVRRVPAWRRQLRSKVFRTTLLVVATHFLFWLPYNFLSLMHYISPTIHESLSENANIFKDLQILITLINPFLYGFSK